MEKAKLIVGKVKSLAKEGEEYAPVKTVERAFERLGLGLPSGGDTSVAEFIRLLITNFFTLFRFSVRSALVGNIPFSSSRTALKRQFSILENIGRLELRDQLLVRIAEAEFVLTKYENVDRMDFQTALQEPIENKLADERYFSQHIEEQLRYGNTNFAESFFAVATANA